ncbi:Checkpoint kinase 2 [Ceratobasidium sp. 428]|nr:Checkpoint kinase 2 [Ceratobasidium sp. 428]
MGQQHSKLDSLATPGKPLDLTAYITIIEYIKGGGQADIKKARLQYKNESTIVVVKQLRYTEDAVKLAHLEMRMWNTINGHGNVVRFLGKIVDDRGFPSMVAEYCEQGDLLSYAFSVARFNYKDLLTDILNGLKHVHELNLAHGDLKPENIVLTTQSRRLTAKICDFGSARELSSKHVSVEYISTPLYRSPELSIEEEISAPSIAADIWAFGCVAFVMLCKKMPYHWVKNRWTIDFFIATKKPPHSEEDRWPDKSLRRLVQSCWSDMAIRPSADALLHRLTSTRPHSHTPSRGSQPPAYSGSPRVVSPQPLRERPSAGGSDEPLVRRRRRPVSTARSSDSRSAQYTPETPPHVISHVSEGPGYVDGPQIIRIGTPGGAGPLEVIDAGQPGMEPVPQPPQHCLVCFVFIKIIPYSDARDNFAPVSPVAFTVPLSHPDRSSWVAIEIPTFSISILFTHASCVLAAGWCSSPRKPVAFTFTFSCPDY